MDNNFNGQQPQQPVYQAQPQQPVYQAQPQQPVYQAQPQQQMYQAQQPVYGQAPMYQAPKKPSKINALELLALILASVGTLFAILGTTFMCACSADAFNIKGTKASYFGAKYVTGLNVKFSTHPTLIIAILGGLMAIAAVVLAIIALKQKDAKVKAGKMAWISMIVGVFATIYAFVPMFTICGYNCALDSAAKEEVKDLFSNKSSAVEDLFD